MNLSIKRSRLGADLILAFIVLAGALAVACSGNSKPPSAQPTEANASSTATTTAPPATATTSATAATETIAGLPVRVWKILAPAELPRDVVVYIEKGCYQCDGRTSASERVSNVGNPGEATRRVETLFTAPGDPQRYIINFVFGTNGNSAFYATVCSRGYCGGVGQITADAQTTLHVSRDGGISWEVLWTRDGAWSVLSATSEGGLLRHFKAGPGDGDYVNFQGEVVSLKEPQPGATPVDFGGFFGYAWLLSDRVTFVNSRGEVLFSPPAGFRHDGSGIYALGVLDNRNPEGFVVSWSDQRTTYQGVVRGGTLQGVYRSSRNQSSPATPGVWLGPSTAVGNMFLVSSDLQVGSSPASGGNLPVLIDFDRAEITPLLLYGPLTEEAYRGRNYIRSYQTATFWRVATGGDCLNLRATFSATGAILGCLKDNVLLKGAGPARLDETGVLRGAMIAPGNIQGWVAMEHVVRR